MIATRLDPTQYERPLVRTPVRRGGEGIERRLTGRRFVLSTVLLTTYVALAAAAAGGLLDAVDRPLQEATVSIRSAWATDAFLVITGLGSGLVVTVGALVLAVLAWRRCPPLATLILFAAVARPVLSSVLKGLIDRPRPDLDPLVAVGSSSFPSGHVLAAALTWAFVPLVVATFTSSRRLRTVAFAVSWCAIGLVAVSRVYLGAHWTTDVTGALLIGALVALVVPHVSAVIHGTPGVVPCAHRDRKGS